MRRSRDENPAQSRDGTGSGNPPGHLDRDLRVEGSDLQNTSEGLEVPAVVFRFRKFEEWVSLDMRYIVVLLVWLSGVTSSDAGTLTSKLRLAQKSREQCTNSVIRDTMRA